MRPIYRMALETLIVSLLLLGGGGCESPAVQIGPTTRPMVETTVESGAMQVDKEAFVFRGEPGMLQVTVNLPTSMFDKASTWVGIVAGAIGVFVIGWIKQSPISPKKRA